jgi:hypothetical protein
MLIMLTMVLQPQIKSPRMKRRTQLMVSFIMIHYSCIIMHNFGMFLTSFCLSLSVVQASWWTEQRQQLGTWIVVQALTLKKTYLLQWLLPSPMTPEQERFVASCGPGVHHCSRPYSRSHASRLHA